MKRLGYWGRPVLVGMILAAAAVSPSYSQPPGAAFLDISPSPRSYALGGADLLASVGAQALGANPANLGLGSSAAEVFANYQSLIDGSQYDHLAAAFSPRSLPGGLEAFGVSVTRLATTGIPTADASGNKTGGSFSAADLAVTLGACGRLGNGLHIGGDVKALQSTIGSYDSSVGLAADLGASYAWKRDDHGPITFAAGVTNAGEGIRFISQRDPLPTTVSLGAAAPLTSSLDLVVVLGRELFAQTTDVHAGLEWSIGPAALRAGYSLYAGAPSNLALNDSSQTQQILGSLSAGVGVKFGGFKFDYAMSTQAVDYGTTQRVAISYAWGGQRKRPSNEGLRSDAGDPAMIQLGGY